MPPQLYSNLNKSDSQGWGREKEKQNALNELRILASLNHPYIIKYRDCFLKDEVLSIITDLAEGGDLSTLIKRYKQEGKRFREDIIVKYF